jgi:hypothetical protein
VRPDRGTRAGSLVGWGCGWAGIGVPGDSRTERGPTAEAPLVCAECARAPRAGENATDDWRAYSDGAGELITFCPECAEREFG